MREKNSRDDYGKERSRSRRQLRLIPFLDALRSCVVRVAKRRPWQSQRQPPLRSQLAWVSRRGSKTRKSRNRNCRHASHPERTPHSGKLFLASKGGQLFAANLALTSLLRLICLQRWLSARPPAPECSHSDQSRNP